VRGVFTRIGAECVFEDELSAGRDGLVGEDVGAEVERFLCRAKTEMTHEDADVFDVSSPSGVDLHGEQMLRRCGRDTESGVVEHLGSGRVTAWRHVGAGLLVEPPWR